MKAYKEVYGCGKGGDPEDRSKLRRLNNSGNP